jgi:hypothetical protein
MQTILDVIRSHWWFNLIYNDIIGIIRIPFHHAGGMISVVASVWGLNVTSRPENSLNRPVLPEVKLSGCRPKMFNVQSPKLYR